MDVFNYLKLQYWRLHFLEYHSIFSFLEANLVHKRIQDQLVAKEAPAVEGHKKCHELAASKIKSISQKHPHQGM